MPEDVMRPLERLQGNMTICTPAVSQIAALGALQAVDELEALKDGYRRNRRPGVAPLPRRAPGAAPRPISGRRRWRGKARGDRGRRRRGVPRRRHLPALFCGGGGRERPRRRVRCLPSIRILPMM